MIQLQQIKPFAQGGNRLCFVHPEDASLCIKVRRPDFTLEARRRKKGFPKNLRPLSSFDDNLEEFREMEKLSRYYGERAFRHISRCYGFIDTDLGKGLISELVRNFDGRIAITLKQCLWENGLTDQVMSAIDDFIVFWIAELIPSRDLLLHNIVVQLAENGAVRLVVIDGLGAAGIIPFQLMPRWYRARRVVKKIDNFRKRIEDILQQRGSGAFPGCHGLLFHDGLKREATIVSQSCDSRQSD
jgi:hypothetical protein